MSFRNPTDSGPRPAEISALADGSLSSDRRETVQQQIKASKDLRFVYEQEQAAVEILRQAREQDRAPESLRRRVAQERLACSHRRRESPRGLGTSLAAATAAAAATAVLLLTGGSTAGPSVAQAASLATRGPATPGPSVNPDDPSALLAGLGEVYFPNWRRTLGWSTTGQRVDQLAHHKAVTVYYGRHGMKVAYTIVSVPALREPRADVVTIEGLRLRVLSLPARKVVTWRRDGRTCVLSSRNVPTHQLESLAAWS